MIRSYAALGILLPFSTGINAEASHAELNDVIGYATPPDLMETCARDLTKNNISSANWLY